MYVERRWRLGTWHFELSGSVARRELSRTGEANCPSTSTRRLAAVADYRLAGHVVGLGGCGIDDEGPELVHSSRPSERGDAQEPLAHLGFGKVLAFHVG